MITICETIITKSCSPELFEWWKEWAQKQGLPSGLYCPYPLSLSEVHEDEGYRWTCSLAAEDLNGDKLYRIEVEGNREQEVVDLIRREL